MILMIEVIERFEYFTIFITRIHKSIQKIKISESKRLGLKANHVMYMHYIGKSDEGLTHTELCKLCIEDKAAVSRTVIDLTKQGFVKPVKTDSARKYRTKFILTEEGKNINNQINEAIAVAVSKASKDLNESERENFYRILFNITDNLENICDSYL